MFGIGFDFNVLVYVCHSRSSCIGGDMCIYCAFMPSRRTSRLKWPVRSGKCVGNLEMVCFRVCWTRGINGRSSSCEDIDM